MKDTQATTQNQDSSSTKTIFIGGLPTHTQTQELSKFLQSFTSFDELCIKPRHNNPKLNLGFAVLKTSDQDSYDRLISTRYLEFQGKRLEFKPYLEGKNLEKYLINFSKRRLYLNGIPEGAQEQAICGYFSQFGVVQNFYFVQDFKTKSPTGTAVLIYEDEEVTASVNLTKNFLIMGRIITSAIIVEEPTKKSQKKKKRKKKRKKKKPSQGSGPRIIEQTEQQHHSKEHKENQARESVHQLPIPICSEGRPNPVQNQLNFRAEPNPREPARDQPISPQIGEDNHSSPIFLEGTISDTLRVLLAELPKIGLDTYHRVDNIKFTNVEDTKPTGKGGTKISKPTTLNHATQNQRNYQFWHYANGINVYWWNNGFYFPHQYSKKDYGALRYAAYGSVNSLC